MDTFERMNLELEPFIRGDTYEIDVVVSAGMEGGTLYMTAKEYEDDLDADAAASVNKVISAADVSSGLVTLKFAPGVTDGFSIQRHWLDIQYVSLTGSVDTLIRGSGPVIGDITRYSDVAPPPAGVEVMESYSYSNFAIEAA